MSLLQGAWYHHQNLHNYAKCLHYRQVVWSQLGPLYCLATLIFIFSWPLLNLPEQLPQSFSILLKPQIPPLLPSCSTKALLVHTSEETILWPWEALASFTRTSKLSPAQLMSQWHNCPPSFPKPNSLSIVWQLPNFSPSPCLLPSSTEECFNLLLRFFEHLQSGKCYCNQFT